MSTTTICRSTQNYLLGRFIDTEYQVKMLANISTETFNQLKDDLRIRFDDINLTDDDIKEAWKYWFDWAANNGTLVSPDFDIVDPDCNWRHDELQVIDLLLTLANEAIDKL